MEGEANLKLNFELSMERFCWNSWMLEVFFVGVV